MTPNKKIEFVSGLTGSTILHVNLISLVSLASISLYAVCVTRKRLSSIASGFMVSWYLLVLPLLLSMTLYADYPTRLTLTLAGLAAGLVVTFAPIDRGSTLPERVRNEDSTNNTPKLSFIPPLPALSVYRANMMIMTVLAILAVDFQVFPRALAKCETYGVSLMDIGVGSFVFSQGIVSAIPIVKDIGVLHHPVSVKLKHTIRKSLPVLLLGLVRVILVKRTEYPEHVTEYGVHWNFFITLGVLPSVQVLLHPIISSGWLPSLGIAAALVQQLSLSMFGWEKYILDDASRGNLFSANKEGILSLPGYLAIHILGFLLGTILLPSSPSHFGRQRKLVARNAGHAGTKADTSPREYDKTATELFSYAVIFWTGLYVSQYFGFQVSRRMANLPYILWVAAYNATFVLGYLVIDMVFFPLPYSRSIYDPSSKLKITPAKTSAELQTAPSLTPPPLLEAINRNGLSVFLVANVATGLINLSIDTVEVEDSTALLILGVYAFGICLFAWVLRSRRLL